MKLYNITGLQYRLDRSTAIDCDRYLGESRHVYRVVRAVERRGGLNATKRTTHTVFYTYLLMSQSLTESHADDHSVEQLRRRQTVKALVERSYRSTQQRNGRRLQMDWTPHDSVPLVRLFIDTAHENTLDSKAHDARGIRFRANMLLVFVH